MKILAIRGKNLASLEGVFEVDFTVEPLKSAGIFAITGSTGSGKSTLLDAICLALFNDTPRINRAGDNAQIADGIHKPINQKDSRNILRRGTAEAYAEVDFVSLSGDKIRAHWSVRRSRDKVDGSLQSATYKVFNLTANSELQGGKTELLVKVKELIGLTFDQFTRAVLLAQGDFATFLKAAPKEKAELLEKLTGTDIYSRISAKIYEYTKEAEAELNLITEKIKDVEVLTPEQMTDFMAEKEVAGKETRILEHEIEVLSQKVEWLKTDVLLGSSVSSVQVEVLKSKADVEEAKPRFDYLLRVDSIQQIRDDFKQLSNDKKHLETENISLKIQEELRITNRDLLEQVKNNLVVHQTEQTAFIEQWEKLEPQVKEARKVDTQIEGVIKNLTETKNELTHSIEQKSSCGKSVITTETGLLAIEKSQNELASWFEQNKLYADIVPKTELISTYSDDLQSAKEQIYSHKKTLTISTELLHSEENQLLKQQAEDTRLNDLLPTEIVSLRAKLVDNKPCPVCGGIDHPIREIPVESLEEEILNKAKVAVSRDIERLTQNITARKEELIRLNSVIGSYQEQYDKTFIKLSDALKIIPDWQSKYTHQTLKKELQSIAKQWLENTNQQSALNDKLNIGCQELKTLKERLIELSQIVKDKEIKQANSALDLSQFENVRKLLLGGENTDRVENSYKQKLEANHKQIANITAERDALIAKYEKLSGVITQIETRITNLSVNTIDLDKKVSTYLSTREDHLGIEELVELLSKENNWLISERDLLDALKKKEHSAQTTLIERQRMFDEHHKAEIKPVEEETQEVLVDFVEMKKAELNKKRERISEIGLIFSTHEKGRERVKKFEKALEEKGRIAENWSKLNVLFGSADGAKFKVLAQAYTLDVLLDYANKHLKDISKRYVLERVSADSLSLQVVDLDMLSEVRSVHSLSGGESFLISLALALGLSSLSSNRMRVESLFIDEGFGTLDADTLRIAMDALENLQTQGRKIGVISHVAEMTERIPTQIKVIKASNGKSHIEVV